MTVKPGMNDLKLKLQLNKFNNRWIIAKWTNSVLGVVMVILGVFTDNALSSFVINELEVSKPVLIVLGCSLTSYFVFRWDGSQELQLLNYLFQIHYENESRTKDG